METYCVSYKNNTGNKNFNVRITEQNGLMLVSNCAICGRKNQDSSKKSRSKLIIDQIRDRNSTT